MNTVLSSSPACLTASNTLPTSRSTPTSDARAHRQCRRILCLSEAPRRGAERRKAGLSLDLLLVERGRPGQGRVLEQVLVAAIGDGRAVAGAVRVILKADVGSALVELEVEGSPLGSVGLDQVHGALAHHAREVVLGFVPAVADVPVDPQAVVVVVRSRPQNRVPVGPAWSNPGGRIGELHVAVQELAHVHGPVARLPQPLGKHVVLVDQRRVGGGVGGHPVVVGVLPGEQRCARGAALRGGGDVVGELGAMPASAAASCSASPCW